MAAIIGAVAAVTSTVISAVSAGEQAHQENVASLQGQMVANADSQARYTEETFGPLFQILQAEGLDMNPEAFGLG